MIEMILVIDIVIVREIELPHIFSPSEYLPDKSLKTR
jgi:hypothetical protein